MSIGPRTSAIEDAGTTCIPFDVTFEPIAWLYVLPALIINYMGQGALLFREGEAAIEAELAG